MKADKLPPEQVLFLKRVTEEIAGTVMMLVEETRGDFAKIAILESELIRHAIMVGGVLFGGDESRGTESVRAIMRAWEALEE